MKTILGNASYLLDLNGKIVRNDEASKLIDLYDRVNAANTALLASAAGALIVKLLREFAEVASFKVCLSVQTQDDDGVRLVGAVISEVVLVNDSGDVDPDEIGTLLQDSIENFSLGYSVYETLTHDEPDSYEDVSFSIERTSFAELLASEYANGMDAFRIAFPENMAIVDGPAQA
jgi:hypothetical protein